MLYVQELPLVLFTLLAQMAVGIVLVGQCIILCGPGETTRERARFQSLAAVVIFGIAALISLGHTGTPLHGPFTILNIASSWLSREIAMVGVTGFSLLLLAFLRFRKPPSSKENLAAFLVILVGIILSFVMSNVYNQRFMPGWHSPTVFPLFLSSMFLFGAVWHSVALSIQNASIGAGSANAGMPILFWGIVGLVVMAVCLPMALPDPATVLNATPGIVPSGCLAGGHAVHAAASGLAVLLTAMAALHAGRGKGFKAVYTIPAFALLLFGEITGRLMFYLSYSRLGM